MNAPLMKYRPCLNGTAFAGMFSNDGLYRGERYDFYLAADVEANEAALRAELAQVRRELIAYKHTEKSVESIEDERDLAEQQLAEAQATIARLEDVLKTVWEKAANLAENEPCETDDPLNHACRIAYAIRERGIVKQ